jgi:DNA invertase Pin-like site-specific DNA recombinase
MRKTMDLYEIRKLLDAGKSIFDLSLRVTFYARVSSGTVEQAHSLANQLDHFPDLIKSYPNWTYVTGYVDEAASGKNVAKRDNFLKMIEDSKRDKFDFVITKEISRFCRNTLDSIMYTRELLKRGIGVWFQADNINTLMPDAELRLTIMSSIAQDELRRLSERVKFGYRQAIKNGIVLGNNRIWGYTKQNGKLVIDEAEAEIVRHVFEIYAGGKGMRLVCAWLTENGFRNQEGNEFTPSTIKGILRNPKYKGYYCGNKFHKVDYMDDKIKMLDESEWVMYKDLETVPPIVTEEIWQRANDILEARSKNMELQDKSVHNNRYAYSSKVICEEHGVPYYRKLHEYKSGSKEVWYCKEYLAKGKKGCSSPSVFTVELDSIVQSVYTAVVSEKEDIISKTMSVYEEISKNSTIKADILRIKAEISDYTARKDKLLDLITKELISDDEFKQRNTQINGEILELQSKLTALEESERKNRSMHSVIESFRKAIETELDFKEGYSSYILDSLIDRIVVHKTDDKKIIDLSLYLKLTDEKFMCTINRNIDKKRHHDSGNKIVSSCNTSSKSSVRTRF